MISLKTVLVFKSPHRIDWPATEKKLMSAVIKAYPDQSMVEQALSHASHLEDIRKKVKKYGVNQLYLAWLDILESENSMEEK